MKKSKVRNTLAGKIESQTDINLAQHIATHGRILTEDERAVEGFLHARDALGRCTAMAQTNDDPLLKQVQKVFADGLEQLGKKLSDKLISAILNRKPEVLRTVADVVEKRSGIRADKRRSDILILRKGCEEYGQKWTIKKLAEMLEIPESEDGHAALRRLCKKLKFPLAAETKGRHKKIQTRKATSQASKS